MDMFVLFGDAHPPLEALTDEPYGKAVVMSRHAL